MTINQALAGFVEVSDGDVIKSQYTMAQYSPNIGWIGDLTYLEPGVGYMMRTAKAGNFYYPNLNYSASSSKFSTASTKLSNEQLIKTSILESSFKYSTNMNIIAEIVNENPSVESSLRAYVGNELRGEAFPVSNPITKKQTYFITIYGQKTEDNLRFEWVNTVENKTVHLSENFFFKPDVVLGSTPSPILFNVAAPITVDTSILSYPNPFTNSILVKLYPGHTATKVLLYDISGKEVKKVELNAEQSEMLLDTQSLPSGNYIITVLDYLGNNLYTQKLIK
jgi:hypothetical protein